LWAGTKGTKVHSEKEGKRRREKGKERMEREMPLLHRCNNSAAIFTAFVRIQGALADAPLQRHDGACVSGIGSEFSPRHNEPFYRGGAGRKEREKKEILSLEHGRVRGVVRNNDATMALL